ncbi:TPA: ankyrin repeat domain-containing protein [Burkholderia vietnamiensis]|nr:ankyrin repeat domain-containing protein [Burkholderia vietnamiensis]
MNQARPVIDVEIPAEWTNPDALHEALHWAASQGDLNVVTAALAYGADPNCTDSFSQYGGGFTALHKAKDKAIADLLLDYGASIEARDGDGRTPLHLAAQKEDRDLVERLIDRGADVNARGKKGETPLHEASSRRQGERNGPLEALIQAGAHLDAVNLHGQTALHKACVIGFADGAKALLQAGANPEIGDKKKTTPLHIAALTCSDCVDALLLHGADVHAVDANGKTPLHISAHLHFSGEITRLLLESGANPNIKDKEGQTPLHRVSLPSLDLLLDHGADVHARDHQGSTPLHTAVHSPFGLESPDAGIIERLVAGGADAHTMNAAGETPMQRAETLNRNLAATMQRALVAREQLALREAAQDVDPSIDEAPAPRVRRRL